MKCIKRVALLALMISCVPHAPTRAAEAARDVPSLQTRAMDAYARGEDASVWVAALKRLPPSKATHASFSGRSDEAMAAETALHSALVELLDLLKSTAVQARAERAQQIEQSARQVIKQMQGLSLQLQANAVELSAQGKTRAAQRMVAARAFFQSRQQALSTSLAQAKATLQTDNPTERVQVYLPMLERLVEQLSAPALARRLGAELPISDPAFAPRALSQAAGVVPVYSREEPYTLSVRPDDYALDIATPMLPEQSAIGAPVTIPQSIAAPCDAAALHDAMITTTPTAWYAGAAGSTAAGRNDVDQASQLIYALRRCGIAARYVHGIVEVPLQRLQSMLGLGTAASVAQALAAAGIPYRAIQAAGQVNAFQIEHTFVAALIPYEDYRGRGALAAPGLKGGMQWIPLMPAFKQYLHQPTQIFSKLNLGSTAALDAWLEPKLASYLRDPAIFDNELPIPALRRVLQQQLAALPAPIALADASARTTLDMPAIGLVPNSLPVKVIKVLDEFSRLPTSYQQQLEVVLRAGVGANDAVIFSHRFSLSQLRQSSLVVQYEAASEDDQDVISAYGSLSQTPPYLINVRPVLLIDGASVPGARRFVGIESDGASAPSSALPALAMGAPHRIEITLSSPAGQISKNQVLLAGGMSVLHAGALAATPEVNTQAKASRIMANFAARYASRWHASERELAGDLGVTVVRALPELTLVTLEYELQRTLGLVSALRFKGLSLDALAHPISAISDPLTGVDSRAALIRASAMHGSALEAEMFKDFALDGISTSVGFAQAQRENLPIRRASTVLELGTPNLPIAITEQLRAAVQAGDTVEFVDRELSRNSWRGAVWRQSSEEGGVGYFISTRYAGGSSTEAPPGWLLGSLVDILGAAYADLPNTNPLSGTSISRLSPSEGQAAIVGTKLGRPLVVVVRSGSRVVQGAEVTFSLSNTSQGNLQGNGSVSGLLATAVTDRFGIASVELTVGEKTNISPVLVRRNPDDKELTQAALYLVEATVANTNGVVRMATPFSAYGLPDVAQDLLWGQRAQASSPHSLGGTAVVFAVDQYLNRVSNADVEFKGLPSAAICGDGGVSEPRFFSVPDERCDQHIGTALYQCASTELKPAGARLGYFANLVSSRAGTQSYQVRLNGMAKLTHSFAVSNLTCAIFPGLFHRAILPVDELGFSVQAALPGQTSPREVRYEFLRHPPGPTVSYVPVNPTAIGLLIPPAGGVQLVGPDLLLEGRYTSTHIGARSQSAQADSATLRFRFNLPQPTGPLGDVDYLNDGLRTIQLKIGEILPAPIKLNSEGYPQTPIQMAVRFEVPDEFYRPRIGGLLYENGELIQFVELPEKMVGSQTKIITFPRTIKLNILKNYQLRAGLNGTQLLSEAKPIALQAPIVKGYSAWSAGQPQPALTGFYSPELSMSATIDVQNQYSCIQGGNFGFDLSVPATASLVAYPIAAFNEPSAVGIELIPEQAFTQGAHVRLLTPEKLRFGRYLMVFKVKADNADPEEYRMDLKYRGSRSETLPLAHSYVKEVDLFDGQPAIQRVDMDLGGRGPGLKFIRSYNPHNGNTLAAVGMGWRSNYDLGLSIDPCGTATLIGSEGQGMRFAKEGQPQNGVQHYRALYGYHGTLRTDGQGADFYSKDGTRFHLSERGEAGEPVTGMRLRTITDVNGNSVRLSWGTEFGKPVLRRVRDDAGRALDFIYAGSVAGDLGEGGIEIQPLLKQVSGPDGLRTDFQFDAQGKLIRTSHNGGARIEEFGYQDLGNFTLNTDRFERLGWRLNRITDGINQATRSYSFEVHINQINTPGGPEYAPEARVISLSETDQGTTSFLYSGRRGSAEVPETTVTDARNLRHVYQMNGSGAVILQTSPRGVTVTSWNAAAAQPESITDVLGRVSTFTYDAAGNQTSETIALPGAAVITRSWTYLPESAFPMHPGLKNRMETSVDGNGHVSRYSYDDHGNRIGHLRQGAGRDYTESWSYLPSGDLASHTDFRGNTTIIRLDSYGYPASRLIPDGGEVLSRFDARGRKLSETDANGNRTSYDYDGRDRVIQTDFPIGSIKNNYTDASNTLVVTDELERQSTTVFDRAGRKRSVTDAEAQQSLFEYDELGNMTEMRDPNGNITTLVYDDGNFLRSKTEPEGKLTTYITDALGHVLLETSKGASDAPRVIESAYKHGLYQPTLRIVKGTSAGDLRTQMARDGNGNVITLTDPRNNVTITRYDAFDRPLEITEPLGKTTTNGYDANGNLTSVTQTRGTPSSSLIRSTQFDRRNLPTLLIDATGAQTLQSFDLVGNLLRSTNARGAITEMSYDTRNRLLSRTGPLAGRGKVYTLDAVGNILTETHGNARVITHIYDQVNRLRSSSDQLGVMSEQTYDKNGNVKTSTDANGRLSVFTYNGLNQRTIAALPAARTLRTSYTVWGELLSETDANGHETKYKVDAAGWRTETLLPGLPRALIQMRYDENGNLIAQTDARGAVTTHEYDELNRKRRTEYPAVAAGRYTERWNYDLQGNVISHVDRNGIAEGFGYDPESRLLASNRDGTTLAVRELDAVGNTELLIDARGNSTRSKFDLANRVLEIIAANGDVSKTSYDVMDNVKTQTDGANRTSVMNYDFRNRKTEQRNALNEKTIHTYDGVGNLKTTQRPIGLWTYRYDAADRLETLTTPEQHVTTYRFDKNGNRLSVKNANGHETVMSYTERNQLGTLRYASGENESYRYDPNDNRTERTDANGVIHTLTYDALNRLTNQAAPTTIASQAAASAMRYDGNGNLLSVIETLGDGSTKTELSVFDRRDRLAQKTDRNGRVIAFGYDAASNPTSYTDSDGTITTREFDRKNRLIKTLRATLGAVLLSYTGADELKTVTHPNGTETTRSYDAAGRLQTIEVKQGSVIVSSRHYSFDANGNRKTQVEQNGGAAESSSYDYDDDNRLIKVIGPDQTETYTLDAAGNRKTEVITNLTNVTLANKTYDYNDREQLTSVSDASSGVTTTYRYDANGNQTEVKVGPAAPTLYTWGPRDQLASVSTGAAFEYDSAGHRTAKTASGNRTQYIWHGDELIAETNTLGSSLSQYTRAGTLLLGEVRGGVAQHFDQDAFNSVMLATNADGSIPGRASYRAYGKVRQLTGVLATPFRFNGYVDDGGDELSSPSRYYTLGTGRFTSMDPAKPDQMNPMSWNAYVGLNSNPMSYVDPDGRCGLLAMPLAAVGFGGACDVIDGYTIGNYDRSAIQEYREGALVGAAQSTVEGVVGGVRLAGNLALSGVERVSGADYGASDQVGAVVSGMVDIASDPSLALTNYAEERVSGFNTAIKHRMYGQAGEVMGRTQLEVGGTLTGAAGAARGGASIAGRAASRAQRAFENIQATARSAALYEDTGFARHLDAELEMDAHQRRGVESVEPKVVVEGPSIDPWRTNSNQSFSGHGLWMYPLNERIALGEGQYFISAKPDSFIHDSAGIILEREGLSGLERAAAGEIDMVIKEELVRSLQNLRLYGPGDQVPNYVLLPHDWPAARKVSPPQPGSIGVRQPTPLSRLLGDEPGCYIWSACTQMFDGNRPD